MRIARRRRGAEHTAPLPLVPRPTPLRADPSLFAGYPAHRRTTLTVGSEELELRPALPSDLGLLDALVRRQSLETRYRRFHAPVHHLTAEQLAGLVDVDHRERETLVVVAPGPRRSRAVAVAQYVTVGDGAAEIALLVDDAWQSLGLGRRLAAALVAAAREAGVTDLLATVLSDNEPALRLMTSLAEPTVVRTCGGETELVVPLVPPSTREEHDVAPATSAARDLAASTST